MSRSIDYWFTLASPWAFLGHQAFRDLAKAHGVDRALQAGAARRGVSAHRRPAVAEAPSGAAALPHPRAAALARGARHRAEAEPEALALPDRAARPHHRGGRRKRRRSGPTSAQRAFTAIWVEDRDLEGGRDAGRAGSTPSGHDGQRRCSRSAKSDAIGAIYAARAQEAVDANVIGSPCYVLDGEVFWGQDRLGLLESALKSGRKAYRMDAAGVRARLRLRHGRACHRKSGVPDLRRTNR